MTLNITLQNPWGLWQCSDHRLWDPTTDEMVDDGSIKCLSVHSVDESDPLTVLVTYCGVGSVGDVHLSDWLRRLLRREERTLTEILQLIETEASRQLGPIVGGRYRHSFSIGSCEIAELRVFTIDNGDTQRSFTTFEHHPTDGHLVLIEGCKDAITASDLRLLEGVSTRRPGKLEHYRNLLFRVNERASDNAFSRNSKLVSFGCESAMLDPNGVEVASVETGGDVHFAPMIINGYDSTDETRLAEDWVRKAMAGEETPDLDEEIEKLQQDPVTQDKRLKR